ncbi:MAG: metallophosphoesterase family protein [Anaerolineales bacterium]|nr:metallophosphoesterase family protein [Anaerolineales bacterium]
MRIALIADIHANLPALETVLAHACSQAAEAVWNLGDLVGYGAFPEEVVQRVQQENILGILGNYDRKVLRFPQKAEKWRSSKRSEKYFAFGWAYNQLSTASRAYLSALPQTLRIDIEGQRILLTHGSPAAPDEHLGPDTPLDRLETLALLAQVEIVLCGHSHQPFARQAASTWFINPGSVGRPDDGDPRAAYAMLEISSGNVIVCHHRLTYDLKRAVSAIRARGLPEVFAQMIIQGCALDMLQER